MMEIKSLIKGLIIKDPWIDLILDGKKKWEIRSSATKIRGRILLIKSGTGCIWGEANLVDCFKVSVTQLQDSVSLHRIPPEKLSDLNYSNPYAWVLEKPQRYEKHIPYRHPHGAIVWVNIDFK